jgi:biotin carboxylase
MVIIKIYFPSYRDKVLMKEICVKHGVKTPIFSAVESASDVISFTSQHDFPVVVKPKMGIFIDSMSHGLT